MTAVVLPSRYWAKVQKTDSCWLWTGSTTQDGYGTFKINGKSQRAHRLSVLVAGVDLLSTDDVDHLCHVVQCVNPDHLKVVSRRLNMENRRGARRESATGVRGVRRLPSGRYEVRAESAGRRYYGGTFNTLSDAERAAVALRNKHMTNNVIDRQEAS